MLDSMWLANKLSLWTYAQAIFPGAPSALAVGESNPPTFFHRYRLPDPFSLPARFRSPAIPRHLSLFAGAGLETWGPRRFFLEPSLVRSLRLWFFRPTTQARRQQRASAGPGVGRRRRHFILCGVSPILHSHAQFGVG